MDQAGFDRLAPIALVPRCLDTNQSDIPAATCGGGISDRGRTASRDMAAPCRYTDPNFSWLCTRDGRGGSLQNPARFLQDGAGSIRLVGDHWPDDAKPCVYHPFLHGTGTERACCSYCCCSRCGLGAHDQYLGKRQGGRHQAGADGTRVQTQHPAHCPSHHPAATRCALDGVGAVSVLD